MGYKKTTNMLIMIGISVNLVNKPTTTKTAQPNFAKTTNDSVILETRPSQSIKWAN
jgi:hypothetical protein